MRFIRCAVRPITVMQYCDDEDVWVSITARGEDLSTYGRLRYGITAATVPDAGREREKERERKVGFRRDRHLKKHFRCSRAKST